MPASEAPPQTMRDMLSCHGLSGLPHLLPVPRYRTFRNEKFFRILEGENAKTERIKNLTQMYQISNFKDSSGLDKRGLSQRPPTTRPCGYADIV